MVTPNMELVSSQNRPILVIKSWQAILTVTLWVVITVAQFIVVRSQTEQNTKDIDTLRQETVNKERFEELREDVIHRLDRIEAKIDEQKAIQKLN
jgi:cell division protein FtsB